MTYGLRVWNSSGDLIQDISDRLGRVFAEYTIPGIAYPNTYNLAVAGYALDGNWFWAPTSAVPVGIGVTESAGNLAIQNAYRGTTGSFGIVVFRVG